MAGPRNSAGVNDTTSCYRIINGQRYLGWVICPTDARIARYRGSGVRCRRLKDELFICEEDSAKAHAVDAEVGPDY